VRIRPLRAEEVPALARALAALPLLRRYGRPAEQVAGDLVAALARGDGLLVAEAEGAAGPAGLAWFLRAGTFGMGGYLRLIAVVDGAQGSGVGAALLAAFEAEVARAGRHAFLLVSDFNEAAQRFYDRHGYQRAGALPGLVLPDVAEVIYWKRLR
jgi:ribosomal protein S18 acetylase RimI-like enzyme